KVYRTKQSISDSDCITMKTVPSLSKLPSTQYCCKHLFPLKMMTTVGCRQRESTTPADEDVDTEIIPKQQVSPSTQFLSAVLYYGCATITPWQFLIIPGP
ncbi:hypothetical protein STEG23_028890, partial [Scotinomys teguina]